jgi:gas vesicle protein
MTGRRLKVLVRPEEKWRTKILESLKKYAFIERRPSTETKQVTGFVQAKNIFSAIFEEGSNEWVGGDLVWFAWRIDKAAINAKKVKSEINKQVEKWKEENAAERCPAAVKKQIKAMVEEEAYGKAAIRTKSVEILWNIEGRYVLIGSTSESDADEIRKIFRRAFGVPLIFDAPGVVEMTGENDEIGAGEIGLDARGGYLNYLASVSDVEDDGKTKNDFELWTGPLVELGTDGKKVAVRGEGAFKSKECKQAIVAGLEVKRLELVIVRDEAVYGAQVETDPSVFKALALPLVIGGDNEEGMQERAALFETWWFTMTSLGNVWRKSVEDDGNAMVKLLKKLQAWAQKGLEEK